MWNCTLKLIKNDVQADVFAGRNLRTSQKFSKANFQYWWNSEEIYRKVEHPEEFLESWSLLWCIVKNQIAHLKRNGKLVRSVWHWSSHCQFMEQSIVQWFIWTDRRNCKLWSVWWDFWSPRVGSPISPQSHIDRLFKSSFKWHEANDTNIFLSKSKNPVNSEMTKNYFNTMDFNTLRHWQHSWE